MAEGKDRLWGLPSMIGKMPVSLPLTTRSALTRMMKSGSKPILSMSGKNMQRLFRSSATTMQSFAADLLGLEFRREFLFAVSGDGVAPDIPRQLSVFATSISTP